VLFGVEQGIVLALILSMIAHVRRGYRPNSVVMTRTGPTRWKPVAADQAVEAVPGMIVYRFAASLYYANTNRFEDELRTLAARNPGLRWLCIDAGVIADVDYSAGQALLEIQPELARAGVRMVWSSVSEDVRAQLDRYGLTHLIGEDAYFETFGDAVAAFEHTTARA
jgi:MFS superfamily sulfate permease-like transporter